MELLILGIMFALVFICFFLKKEKKEKTYAVKRIYKEIADINTLLQNVEAYDGTSFGQKPIGKGGRR